jgi:hypothetical protein
LIDNDGDGAVIGLLQGRSDHDISKSNQKDRQAMDLKKFRGLRVSGFQPLLAFSVAEGSSPK